ncbi:MAG: VWA domain-containing protein [Myxococcales bacterium]|nr:VWA domain-containing protein [Myxococcales bacterium]
MSFEVDVVVRHPLIAGLGRDEPEQSRVEAFARDLARWLVGRPRRELGPLARVVTLVAQRELRPTRRLCHERPLMAVEASARATAALWPLLREDTPPPEAEPPEPTEGEGGALGAPGEEEDEGEGEGAGEQEEQQEQDGEEGDGDGDEDEDEEGEDVLRAMLGDDADADDPDLDALVEQLRRQLGGEGDAAEEAADALADMTEAAAEGAIETDRAARHLERFVPGIGWSTSPGQLEMALLDRLDRLALLLRDLPELEHLADALGRIEDATREEGRQHGGREEVVGVRFSGEVAHALPAELALLGDPDTEDLFYARWTEHQLVSLELSGAGDEGRAAGDRRGPVIACIDTSASMEGPPELAAKALVLAICRAVIPRGRVVHLLLFGGRGEQTEIRLRRGLGGLESLLDFLFRSFHSGTDFDGPLLRAMDLLDEEDLQAADVLVVTDGLCRAAPEVVDRVASVRAARGVRVWSVVLGHRDTRGVDPFSDHVLRIDPTDAAGGAKLVWSVARR